MFAQQMIAWRVQKHDVHDECIRSGSSLSHQACGSEGFPCFLQEAGSQGSSYVFFLSISVLVRYRSMHAVTPHPLKHIGC